jgi:protein-tyrosine phosphatase
MDIVWLTRRIAVGGGIWNAENMAQVARAGITHIIDMQIEFDDTPLAGEHGIVVLWNPTDDDFEAKPAVLFQRGVDFALKALDEPDAKLYVHCAAGVHRAPMMTLALLGSMGWDLEDAMELIQSHRPAADLAEFYVSSVQRFMDSHGANSPRRNQCPVEAILGYRDSREAHSPSQGSRDEEMRTVRHFGRDIVLQEGQALDERLRMMAGKPLPPPSPLRSLYMKLYCLHLGYWPLAILRRAAIGIGLRPLWRRVRSLRERSGNRRPIS